MTSSLQSYTGIQILRVLIANKIGPILLIAFTNHALDNIIAQVLEKNITRKVVRLGSRSNNETVGQYSLGEIMRKRPKERAGNKAYAEMKEAQEDLKKLMDTIIHGTVEVDKLEEYLEANFPRHRCSIHNPQPWVSQLFGESLKWEEAQEGGAHVVRKAGTLFEYWHQGRDLAFLIPPPEISAAMDEQSKKSKQAKKPVNQFSVLKVSPGEEGGKKNPAPNTAVAKHSDPMAQWQLRLGEYFAKIPLQNGVPRRPTGNREPGDLVDDPDVWDMSLSERQSLHAFWLTAIREAAHDDQVNQFIHLHVSHDMARTEWNELMDTVWASDGVPYVC